MRKMKRTLMACLIAVFAATLGLGFGFMPKTQTAKAAVATEYTVVETPMLGKIQECYSAGGNINLFVMIPGLDNEVTGDGISFEGVDLPTVFNNFGFFDNVMIGGKTLRELGCTTFWDNALGYDVGAPKPEVYLHLHFDPATLAAAMADGTVNLGHMTMSTVTIKEGALIPGYRYLKGLDNAVVYKAGCNYESVVVDGAAWERNLVGKTEVESIRYIQQNSDGSGYLGVSLKGDDFLGAGAQEDGVGNNLNEAITGWYDNDTVLLNGETGKVGRYSLINLGGDKGKGYYAFHVTVSSADLTSITIPAGTKFPMYFYTGAQGSPVYNGGSKLVCYYEIQTTKTFTKSPYTGNWVAETKEIEASVEHAAMFIDGTAFAGIKVAGSDHATAPNTWNGGLIDAKTYAHSENFTSHVLLDDVPLSERSETFLNVWGKFGYFTFRPGNGEATKITVLAGCRIPTYNGLVKGIEEVYVIKEDVTFIKNDSGEWVNANTPVLPNSYRVNFKHEDGTLISTVQVEENATVSQPVNPTKAHANMFKEYIFDGWYLGDANYDFGAAVASDLDIIAKFTEADRQANTIDTAVVMVKPALNGGNVNDYFLNFELSVNDYAELGTYEGEVITAKDFLKQSNFTQKVLLNDAAYPVTAGTYINVWGIKNVFSTRANDGDYGFPDATALTKITILKGCQFPTYEMLSTGVLKYYVTTEDITFVVKNGVWMEESLALKNSIRFVHEDGTVFYEHVLDGAGTIDRPADPVKDSMFTAYTFDDWYVDGEVFDFDTVIDGDIEITAKFTATAKERTEITSTIETVKLAGSDGDFFMVLGVANSDYNSAPGTYPAGAPYVYTVVDFANQSNFYSHVVINGVPMKTRSEAFINVWSEKGFSIRIAEDARIDGAVAIANVTSIKFLAGCQLPTYKLLSTGELAVLVVLDDVTFTLVDGNWVREEVRVNGAPIELDGYKAYAFREAEKAERDQIVANAKVALQSATTAQEIEEIVATAKAAIDELKTELDYINEELAPLKEAIKNELTSYLADEEYYDFQLAQRENILANAFANIESAMSEDEIAEIEVVAKEELDSVLDVIFKDVAMKAQIANIYAAGGNMNLFITIPGLDLPEIGQCDNVAFIGYDKAALEELFISFGILDKIMINDKTLREWGFVGFWDGTVGFNMAAPNPAIYLHMHTNSQEYKDAVANGEISFNVGKEGGGLAQSMSPVTIKEDLILPGYSFLNGEAAIVYRATTDYVSVGKDVNYSIETVGKVEVGEVAYTQVDIKDDVFVGGYFGIELVGADYPTLEEYEIAVDLSFDNGYWTNVLINGETGKINKYAVFGLGAKGQGKISLSVSVSPDDMYSVTIPAGTKFPTYGGNSLKDYNAGNYVIIVYEVQTSITLIKTADGEWVEETAYKAAAIERLDALRAERVDADYFASDVTAMDTAIATAKEAIASAVSAAQIDEAELVATEVLRAIVVKSETIANAKAELDAYKAEEGLFLADESAQRLAAIESAKTAIDAATTKEEIVSAVDTAKATIDGLKTAEEYAKEAIAGDVANAKAELDAYKAEEGLYREEQAAERQAIVEEAKLALDNALAIDQVNAIVANAKEAIDALKTAAEFDAEESLADAKEDALAQINDKKASLDLTLYSDYSIAQINKLYKDAKDAVDAATTEEEITAAVNGFITAIDAIPTGGNQNTESGEDGGDDGAGGCAGNVNGASAVVGLITLLAAATLLRKKR